MCNRVVLPLGLFKESNRREVNALLRAARTSRYGKRNDAICQLLLQTGMRIGECHTLCWQDIEYKERKGSVLKGNKLSASATGRMFAMLVNDCAARNLMSADTTPHALRHTFAHRYLDQNPGDLIGLARFLGHESLETTKIYVRLTSDDLAQRVEQSAFFGDGR
jgi:site-specific recombinase XerD